MGLIIGWIKRENIISGTKRLIMMTKISETAVIVASLRALSNYEHDIKFNCNDHYAELFLPDEKRIPLQDSQVREMIRKAIPKGMYEYVIARTKYVDGVFLDALKQNIKQIVILGAGFDSRPYRFQELIDKTKIFEVDTEATQQYKLSLLTNKADSIKKIHYVPVNFEETDLFARLKEHGYNKTDKTLFLWEGVTFYLSKDAVHRMLREIKVNSPEESKICFDFQTVKSMDELIHTGIREESIKFGIEEGKIEEFIISNKYRIMEHLSSKDIEMRFMTKEDGVSFGEISSLMNFILIENSDGVRSQD
jgi:methyltransferase (TIGR00027 family)